AGADVPVIVVGSADELDCIARARDAGANDHVLIPVAQPDFHMRASRQLLGQRAPPAARDPIEPPAEPAVDPDHRYPEGSRPAYDTLLRLIDVIPRMICVTGRDGRYLLVNRLFAA